MRKYSRLIKYAQYAVAGFLSLTARPALALTTSIGPEAASFTDLGKLITTSLQVILIAAGLMVLFFLIFGGIRYITSSGDEKQAEQAQKTITSALIGLIIIVAAYALAKVLEAVFGIRIVGDITWPSAAERTIGQ